MRYSRLFFIFLFSPFLLVQTPAAEASAGTEGASFLDIPVGAGPAALGGAYSARASDVYGVIWNPAGLARVPGRQLAGQHVDYLQSIHYEFAGAAIPLRNGSTLGVGVQYLGTGDIQGRGNDGAPAPDFSNHYAAYSMAFGQALGDKLSLGITGKWIEAQLSDVHANAFAADAGALYRFTDRLAVAGTLVNMGSKLTFIDQSDPLPMAGRVGFLYSPLRTLDVSMDGVYRRTGLAGAHTGIEWRPISGISLRAGYRTDTLRELSPPAGVTAGIGLTILGQELAYAWVPMGDLGATQYLSLLLTFGRKDTNGKNLVYLNHAYRHVSRWEPSATLREADGQGGASLDVDQNQLTELLSKTEPEKAMAKAR